MKWVGPMGLLAVLAWLGVAGAMGRRDAARQLLAEDLAAARRLFQAEFGQPEPWLRALEGSFGTIDDLRRTKYPILPGIAFSTASNRWVSLLDAVRRDYSIPGVGTAGGRFAQEIGAARAHLAFLGGRFQEALDELARGEHLGVPPGPGLGSDGDTAGQVDPPERLRADALFGLGSWEEAARLYTAWPSRAPGFAAAMIRAGLCHDALGRSAAALEVYEKAADEWTASGDRNLIRGKFSEGMTDHQQALRLRTMIARRTDAAKALVNLTQSLRRNGDAALLAGQPALARTHYAEADRRLGAGTPLDPGTVRRERALASVGEAQSLLLEGQPEAALAPLTKALELLESQAPDRSESPEQKEWVGRILTSRGAAHLGLQRIEACMRDLDAAVTLQSGRGEELALALNLRGVARRASGNLAGARSDFDAALAAVAPTGVAGGEAAGSKTAASPLGPRLEMLVGFAAQQIEVLTRVRGAGERRRVDTLPLKAVIHRNRAYAALLQRRPADARDDFGAATDLLAALVGQEGQEDLVPQFAASLTSMGRLLATDPDIAVRDGKRARAQASLACELTAWQDVDALDAYSAACAEAGDFTEAVRWQAKATDLAVPARKPELVARLRLYQSGAPYRQPVATAR